MLSSPRCGSLWCGLVALVALAPRSALAQDATPEALVEPTSQPLRSPPESAARDVPPPPPPATSRASQRLELAEPAPRPLPSQGQVHDGFYLRFGFGASYGRGYVQTNRVSQADVVVTGIAPSADLWGGWTVAPGLVLGLALSSLNAQTGSAKIGDDETAGSGSASGLLFGAFVDAYPNPEDGYHFGGVLSFASLTLRTDSLEETAYDAGGVGVSIFAGYDAWIAREWSLGGMLRLGGVVTRDTESIDQQQVTRQGTLYGAALLLTIVHH